MSSKVRPLCSTAVCKSASIYVVGKLEIQMQIVNVSVGNLVGYDEIKNSKFVGGGQHHSWTVDPDAGAVLHYRKVHCRRTLTA